MSFIGFWYVPWVCLPLLAANMLPVIFGRGARPLDSFSWWPKRWPTGGGKTLRGFIFGTLAGVCLTYGLAQALAGFFNNPRLVEVLYLNQVRGWKILFALAVGALLGDLVESVIKRRRGIERGQPWWPWDQLDAVIGGFLGAAIADWPWFYQQIVLNWKLVAIWVVIYLVAHPLFSRGAYLANLKTAPH